MKNEWEKPAERQRPRRKARDKVMDLLARRSHSAFELRKKLSPYYESEELEAAIRFAEESRWILPPAEQAERVSVELGRRNKGHRYINRYLQKKGLPSVEKDPAGEIERAFEVLLAKAERLGLSADALSETQAAEPQNYDERKTAYQERQRALLKLQNALISRGFDHDTVLRAIQLWQARRTHL